MTRTQLYKKNDECHIPNGQNTGEIGCCDIQIHVYIIVKHNINIDDLHGPMKYCDSILIPADLKK